MGEHIKIDATETLPSVDFNFDTSTFSLSGMAYAENIAEFFRPILAKFYEHLESRNAAEVSFTFELNYFNSSAARILFHIFEALDNAAGNGNTVNIHWRYDEEDDSIEEQGEEFGEDLVHAKFELQPFTG